MPTPAEIRETRLSASMTQAEAAAVLGVHPITWARYEGGTRTMSGPEWAYWLHMAGVQRLPFRRRHHESVTPSTYLGCASHSTPHFSANELRHSRK